MIKTNKLIIFWLGVLMCVFSFGCTSNSVKIGILIYDENDTFISELKDYLIEGMPEAVSYEISYASNSQFIQNEQLLRFLEKDVDMLLINAVDRLSAASISEKCEQHQVPVIFFNREPLQSDIVSSKNIYYVGADADSLGVKQADIVSSLFGDFDHLNPVYDKNQDNMIQTVIIKGEQGHQDAEKRTKNCIERLQDLNYQVDLLATSVANWRREEGYSVMEAMYAEFGDSIELVFSNNDDMALGAIDYFLEAKIFTETKESDYVQPIVIIGVDGTKVGLEAIENGLMYGSVLNDAQKQSQAIIELMEYILNGKDMADFPFPIENDRYIYIDGEILLAIQN